MPFKFGVDFQRSSGSIETTNLLNIASYGAAGNSSASNDYLAFERIFSASRESGREIRIPAGVYNIPFERGLFSSDGRLVIDWPDAVITGDGKDRTIINVTLPTASFGRRASIIDSTVPRGRVSFVGTNYVTLETQNDVLTFKNGDNLYFASGSDGTNPRFTNDPGLYTLVANRRIAQGELVISNFAFIKSLVQVGDYVFIRDKVYLAEPDAWRKWSAGMGLDVSPGPTRTNLRATQNTFPLKVLSVDSASNALNVFRTNYMPGFADGDYLFPCPDSSLFYISPDSRWTTRPFNVLIRGMTINAPYYGFDEDDGRGDVANYILYYAPGSVTSSTLHHRLTFEDVSFNGSRTGVFLAESAARKITATFRKTEHRGAVISVAFYADAENTGSDIVLDYAKFWHTSASHHCYIHPNVSIWADHCYFDDTAGHGEGIDHWGQYSTPSWVSISNCYFGPKIGARGYLTAMNGYFSFTNNVVESTVGIGLRCGGSIVGNTFRPDATHIQRTANCIQTYFLAAENAHVAISSNTFDAAKMSSSLDASASMVAINAYAGTLKISENLATCSRLFGPNYNDRGAPAVFKGGFTFLSPADGAIAQTGSAFFDVVENTLTFEKTAGQIQLFTAAVLPNVNLERNRVTGRGSVDRGMISLNTSGSRSNITIVGNVLDSYWGDGIRTDNLLTGSVQISIRDNTISTYAANRSPISLRHGIGCPVEISNNTLRAYGGGVAIVISSSIAGAVPENTVYGRENDLGTGSILSLFQQQIAQRASKFMTVISASSTVRVYPSYDMFVLTGSTPVSSIIFVSGTINSPENYQKAYDDFRLSFLNKEGAPFLEGGNLIPATTGSRRQSSLVTFRYVSDVGKWIEHSGG